MVHLQLKNVTKDFGGLRAVDKVNFEVDEGEILTLLGPSGCGKSTTLRMIAGFLYPEEGRIFFADDDVTQVPPQNRNTAMVFQNYALWPHLSVGKNVEFGLNIRKVPKEERDRRVKEALDRVHLGELKDRMPTKLSGGQQQRVAVSRALVVNPDVLLLDEPLSNLDAKLRVETRQEIRDLVKDLNLTTIYVTHDQSEALSISDRIVVMDVGHLRQIGTPEEIWDTPESAFVGSFIGEANTVEMDVIEVSSEYIRLSTPQASKESGSLQSTYFRGINEVGDKAKVVIRPEQVIVHSEKVEGSNSLPAKIRVVQFFGSYTLLVTSLGNGADLTLHLPPHAQFKRRQKVFLEIQPHELRAFGPSNY
ncbi:MAG: ABC transporter ATP-binding protein [Candidatus Hodarchaeales archaeon]|jgi:iron(III) transport system ATP-binding protein